MPNRFQAAINRGGGEGYEDQAMQRMAEFDPQQSINDSAQAAFASFRDQLSKTITNLRGQQVGMGRLQTGFGTGDEDELVDRGVQNLNQELMRNSMTGAQMTAQNNQAMFSAGAHQTGRFYDVLAGQRDYETSQANAKRERKGNLLGGIGTLLGAGVGAFAGGPAGAKLGASVGGAAGRMFS